VPAPLQRLIGKGKDRETRCAQALDAQDCLARRRQKWLGVDEL